MPTQRGRDFRPVLLSLMAFGNRHFAPEGAMVEVVNTKTGKPADIGVFDRATGLPIAAPDYAMVPGPAANARVQQALRAPQGGGRRRMNIQPRPPVARAQPVCRAGR